MSETFIVYRSRLASDIIASGYELKQKPNPFKPHLTMWEAPLNRETAELTERYYKSIGKEMPEGLRKKFKTILRGEGNEGSI